MNSRQLFLSKVAVLIRAGDGELFEDKAVFALVEERNAARILIQLARNYDYTKSMEFAALVEGRSDAYAKALERRFQEPVSRAKKNTEFVEAIKALDTSEQIFDLLPKEGAIYVEEVRALLLRPNA